MNMVVKNEDCNGINPSLRPNSLFIKKISFYFYDFSQILIAVGS